MHFPSEDFCIEDCVTQELLISLAMVPPWKILDLRILIVHSSEPSAGYCYYYSTHS